VHKTKTLFAPGEKERGRHSQFNEDEIRDVNLENNNEGVENMQRDKELLNFFKDENSNQNYNKPAEIDDIFTQGNNKNIQQNPSSNEFDLIFDNSTNVNPSRSNQADIDDIFFTKSKNEGNSTNLIQLSPQNEKNQFSYPEFEDFDFNSNNKNNNNTKKPNNDFPSFENFNF
jgi:hypothetical protein